MAVDYSNVRIYLGRYDISGDVRTYKWTNPITQLPNVTYGATSQSRQGGLSKPELSVSGLVNMGAGLSHGQLRALNAVKDVPATVAQDGGVAGVVAHFMKAMTANYKPSGRYGEMLGFEAMAKSQGWPLIRGYIFVSAISSKTATGTSAVIQLGAAALGQRVYAAQQVIAVTGTTPSLLTTVKSSAAVGMTSPTTQLTFASIAIAGHEWKQTAGLAAISDTYYRVDYTIAGTTPAFLFLTVVGIY